MSTETLIWLFPIVFMIHDFEEIIMMPAWIRKNRAELERRWPRQAPRALALIGGLSTPAFALAVMILFIFISVTTFLVAQFQLYALWGGMLLILAIHFLIHIGSWILLRRYVPVIVTSLLSVPYWLYALWYVLTVLRIPVSGLLLYALVSAAGAGLVFVLALRIAKTFDRHLHASAEN